MRPARLRIASFALLLSTASSGCEPRESTPAVTRQGSADLAPPLLVAAEPLPLPRTIEKEGGLRVEIEADGSGAPIENGRTALIRYHARVLGAEQGLGSTDGLYQPLAVPVGQDAARTTRAAIVPGLARGLEGLRVGSRARIEVPPALAYGSKGAPGAGVPEGATLEFEVEVVGAR